MCFLIFKTCLSNMCSDNQKSSRLLICEMWLLLLLTTPRIWACREFLNNCQMEFVTKTKIKALCSGKFLNFKFLNTLYILSPIWLLAAASRSEQNILSRATFSRKTNNKKLYRSAVGTSSGNTLYIIYSGGYKIFNQSLGLLFIFIVLCADFINI